MPQPKAGSLKDPDIAGLFFFNDDPEKIFVDLREIGHGSFGAVYFARNIVNKEIVAIKKMSYNGKQANEKWQDIIKEVKFLRQLKHRHVIDYKGCYLREHTAWLVMEYCLGSASDIVEVHKKPLKEIEIAAICHDALEGLAYLHTQGKIHRDIKAGNILLTENGTVKLADFGSASLISPANSFVGTPYWMAPEVILAMDEGQYDGKSDVWSMGITCIELAERKPPLFNMNAMSALYHIAQNDPPTLAGGEWSDSFRHFVDSCLAKLPCDRPSSSDILKHHFLEGTGPSSVIIDLIQRTKDAVRELDNLQYRRMKKILMVDVIEGENSSNGPTSDDFTTDDSSQDDDNIDSSTSKSSSMTSQHSMPSSNLSSKSSSQSSLQGISTDDSASTFHREHSDWSLPQRSSYYSNVHPNKPSNSSINRMEAGANNFATIRTTHLVTKQMKDHEHANDMKEQFTGYKRMRKTHQKQLQQNETKFQTEMEEHKQRLDKEYDNLRQKFLVEMEKIRKMQSSDQEKMTRNNLGLEKKLIKQISTSHDTEKKTFSTMQKKEYKVNKEQMKKEIDGSTPKKERDDMVRTHKDRLLQRQKEAEGGLEKRHKDSMEFEIRKFRRRKLVQYHQKEEEHLAEELSKRQAQLEMEHAMLLRHHSGTQDLEYRQLQTLQKLRDDHLKKQHLTEHDNQREYNALEEQNLRKKHLLEHKQQPRSLKQKEVLIRKQFHEAVQTQRRQYKALKEHILQNTPKNEQKAVVKKLKEEQVRKLNILGEQYEASIAEMLQQQNMRLDDSQEMEAQQLKQRLQQELELLMAYQSKIKMQTEAQHQRERRQLEERVSLRRALLEQKMDDERSKLIAERKDKIHSSKTRQERDLEDFDHETSDMGMSPVEVAQASLDATYNDDVSSLRGSMISLTASSSSFSFSSQT
ncbi:serine/threonine-protein kinase TAO1-like isoform X9 [Mizuhopecten yessoensis]|uniref:non-specific serine/threonine protein kinase n=1 Tax=Mizuhopecten yessoensis TaxID=6573 RepID=A0A210PUV6_MIZYE|nr:serine/threonine-protein kinase TAO1-like isoform X9 [Mizuhopecten yessoensis]OWF40278.1 Serine/threonine-protein kinase TAO1 [Mizuhopecten yessoensis]